MTHALYAPSTIPSNDPRRWRLEPADRHGDGSVVVRGRGVVSPFELKAFGDKATLEALQASASAVYDYMTPEVDRLSARHHAIEKPAYEARRAAESAARAQYNALTQASRKAAGDAAAARWAAVMAVVGSPAP